MIKIKDKTPLKIDLNSSTKKVYFGDDGSVVDKPIISEKIENSELSSDQYSTKNKLTKKSKNDESNDVEKKWYHTFQDFNTNELKELSDFENKTLSQICRHAFNELVVKLEKSKTFLILLVPLMIFNYLTDNQCFFR